MIKLGTNVTDQVTGIKGILLVLNVEMGGNINYLFQPGGLNPKTKKPLDSFWITKPRVLNAIEIEEDLPMNILGSHVMDKATGFKGIAISFNKYINGCVHISIKSPELLEETNETIESVEFDIRRLIGKEIIELNEEELIENRKENPSPEVSPIKFKR